MVMVTLPAARASCEGLVWLGWFSPHCSHRSAASWHDSWMHQGEDQRQVKGGGGNARRRKEGGSAREGAESHGPLVRDFPSRCASHTASETLFSEACRTTSESLPLTTAPSSSLHQTRTLVLSLWAWAVLERKLERAVL
eukprot:1434627-Rhodomonas_salina.3